MAKMRLNFDLSSELFFLPVFLKLNFVKHFECNNELAFFLSCKIHLPKLASCKWLGNFKRFNRPIIRIEFKWSIEDRRLLDRYLNILRTGRFLCILRTGRFLNILRTGKIVLWLIIRFWKVYSLVYQFILQPYCAIKIVWQAAIINLWQLKVLILIRPLNLDMIIYWL